LIKLTGKLAVVVYPFSVHFVAHFVFVSAQDGHIATQLSHFSTAHAEAVRSRSRASGKHFLALVQPGRRQQNAG
jgi:hypothetical protein